MSALNQPPSLKAPFDCVIAVCDDRDSLRAAESACGRNAIILAPSIARPEFLNTLPAYVHKLTDLVLPQDLLEGALPTQDSQQLLLFLLEQAKTYQRIKVFLAAAGGIGYYALQARATGLLPDTVIFEWHNVKTCRARMDEAGIFPTHIDHLVAFFQEEKEVELIKLEPQTMQSYITVTACITHHNRPHYLRQSLNSLLQQTRLPDEIFIADDGSDTTEAKALLNAIESEKHPVPLRILRLPHGYLGAARNGAWRAAKTDCVFFMDDDDVAMPHELEHLAMAMRHTSADIVTCQMDYFADESDLQNGKILPRWLPVGGNASLGLYVNLFGPANALFRRNLLERMNGFTTDYGTGHEDWEFYCRAQLNGARIELMPLPLFHCRRRPQASMLYETDLYASFNRNLRPNLDALPPHFVDAARLGFGMLVKAEGHVGPMWQKRHQRLSFWLEKAA